MLSEKQLAANRANAVKSTGPRTLEGKNRSRLNALRHSLTGQVTTLTDPDRAAYKTFTDNFLKDLAPEGALETQLVMRIVSDSWRLNRAAAIEDNLYALGHYAGPDAGEDNNTQVEDAMRAAATFVKQAKNLQLLSLYEQRLNRTLQKNIALLQSIQTERKLRRAAEMEEAKRLLQLSEMKNIPYDPKRDGFVLSVNEIHHAIDRHRRLHLNRRPDFTHFKPRKFAVAA
jgi:hypothetical protein